MCGTTPDSACEVPCARTFGLPLITNGNTPISVREVPCALKPHVHVGVTRKILGSLSDHGCKWTFLDWAKNYRPIDPDIEDGELKMCPMIWCRKTFETNDSAIRHIFDCPRLSNAWYWCPYHRRPERFLECNKGCEIVRKPKMHQAAKFFNWFGRRRSLRRQEAAPEEIKTYQTSKEELADNQIIESPGSDPSSLRGRHFAMAPGWVDQKMSYTGRQSRIAEVYGGEVSELSASHKSMLHEMYDPSALPRQPSTSVFLRRSSPELLHPINSESDRDSLWQRIRGMPAAHRHRSGTSPRLSEWLIMDDPENATSLSSQGPSDPDGSLHTLPDHGDKVPISNASSEQNDPSQFWTSVSPMSHTLSLADLATTTSSPIANVVLPSSPITGLASPPSDVLFPFSPMGNYVYPPSTIVSPATVTRDDSSPGTLEHLQEAGVGLTSLFSSPLQSMSRESNDTRSASTFLKTHQSSLQTINDSTEPSASTAQQTEDGMLQQSIRPVHRQYQFKESGMPSVYSQPDQLGTLPFDSEGLIYSDFCNDSSEPEASTLMIQSFVAQVDTSSSDNPGSLPTVSTAATPPQNIRMASSSQPKNDLLSPPEANRPATAFRVPSFRNPLNRQTSIVTGPMMQKMVMGDADSWGTNAEGSCETPSTTFGKVDSTIIGDGRAESAWDVGMGEGQPWQSREHGKVREEEVDIQELEQSDVGRPTSFPDIQLQSPFDNLIARITSELNSTSSEALDRRQSNESAVKYWPNTCEPLRMSGEQPSMLDSPTSPFSTSKEAATPDSSPTSVMSWTFEDSSQTAEANSYTTSPTDISQASISSTSPDSNNPTVSAIGCRACGLNFKGSLQNARTNLRRHYRASSRHKNKNAGLKCPLLECRDRNRMRSDNLGPHLQNVHGMSSKPERQKIIAQSKLSALGVRSDGIPRRRSGRA